MIYVILIGLILRDPRPETLIKMQHANCTDRRKRRGRKRCTGFTGILVPMFPPIKPRTIHKKPSKRGLFIVKNIYYLLDSKE